MYTTIIDNETANEIVELSGRVFNMSVWDSIKTRIESWSTQTVEL